MMKLDDKWVLVKKHIRSNAMTINEMGFRVITREKNGHISQSLRFRIGGSISDKMEWKDGNKICLYYDKDFEKSLLLVKSDANVGAKLTLEKTPVKNKMRVFTLTFTWDGSINLDRNCLNNTILEHKINKNHTLTFTLP